MFRIRVCPVSRVLTISPEGGYGAGRNRRESCGSTIRRNVSETSFEGHGGQGEICEAENMPINRACHEFACRNRVDVFIVPAKRQR